MNTAIYKNAYGWIAETKVSVTSKMRVVVTTMKRSDNKITTIAREERLGESGLWFYAPFSMWSVRMKISDGRATEKAVASQQAAALLELDDVIAEAKLPIAA